MAKFPEPPSAASLRKIDPDTCVLKGATPLGRIFFRGGDHPVAWDEFRFWGPGQARFDHHLPDPAGKPVLGSRGIYYAAGSGGPGALAVSLAEVFQETRIIDSTDRAPWFAAFSTSRDLTLLDLRGLWPTRAGASSAINSGAKARARRWSQAIYATWPELDGLIYPSSMGGNADAYALFERALTALPGAPAFHRPLSDPALSLPLLSAASTINYGLI
ncbi:RES family NAD+ phosphorylase [Paenirhodobacter populi]|uniref:RES domain-containing protein n=1 Tax=Paenirhodobacter populi TaxID=2306993 RepID=A0A443JR16_9RHOB|nr:RES family NAD+ phosphorylase [Sinirhodobacter populi]RWR22943.1 RES domain-containing protein [Sinirhodobacter populi]